MSSYLSERGLLGHDVYYVSYGNEESKVSKRWFPVVMSLILTALAIYVALSAGLVLCMPIVIERYTYEWTLELRDLRLSPDPASFAAPEGNSSCLTSGSDEYVDISFDIAISKNPSWLNIDIIEVKIAYPEWLWNKLKANITYSSGRVKILVDQRVLADHVRGPEYRQLWHMVKSGQLSELDLSLTGEFHLLGQLGNLASILNWEPAVAILFWSKSVTHTEESDGWVGSINSVNWSTFPDWSLPLDMLGSCEVVY